ncbi:MAG: hypothetical protein JW940_16970 [Polyangiaceae bacterium]|nr:hypothetical protein [Polyangiaceae bacterium]
MPYQPVIRLLDVVKRELGSVDARAELGGMEPSDPRLVWCTAPAGWRLVAVFEEPPHDPADKRAKLESLAESFSGTLEEARPTMHPASPVSARRRLDEALELLATRAAASGAAVVDVRSPEIWGCSEMHRSREDMDTAVTTAAIAAQLAEHGIDFAELVTRGPDWADQALSGLPDRQLGLRLRNDCERLSAQSRRAGIEAWRRHVLLARAMAELRRADVEGQVGNRMVVSGPGLGWMARSFAGIYRALVVYPGPFSELRAEGALVRAMPAIEQLVTALPPADPPSHGQGMRMRP